MKLRAMLMFAALPVAFGWGCLPRRTYEEPPAGSYEIRHQQLKVDLQAISIQAAAVTPAFFPASKVHPLLGRIFIEPEHTTTASVAVISHDLWAERFASDPSIIGRKIQLANGEVVIVGVMPPGFNFPGTTALWIPKRGGSP